MSSDPGRFGDYVDMLGQAASIALCNRAAGNNWLNAVAADNIRYYPRPGTRVHARNEIALGTDLRGTAVDSVVISRGTRTRVHAKNSTVVGQGPRRRVRGRRKPRPIKVGKQKTA